VSLQHWRSKPRRVAGQFPIMRPGKLNSIDKHKRVSWYQCDGRTDNFWLARHPALRTGCERRGYDRLALVRRLP
jgi:hypothetical protein